MNLWAGPRQPATPGAAQVRLMRQVISGPGSRDACKIDLTHTPPARPSDCHGVRSVEELQEDRFGYPDRFVRSYP